MEDENDSDGNPRKRGTADKNTETEGNNSIYDT